MHNDPVYLLDPVFRFLDGLIHDDGDILFLLLVYASVPLIAWILSGGLRRKLLRGKPLPNVSPVLVMPLPGAPPPPPEPPFDPFPPLREPPSYYDHDHDHDPLD